VALGDPGSVTSWALVQSKVTADKLNVARNSVPILNIATPSVACLRHGHRVGSDPSSKDNASGEISRFSRTF